MSDTMRIEPGVQPQAPGNSGAARSEAFSGYRAGQEPGSRAWVSAPMAGAEFRHALVKLTQVMETGQPLRHDVPRGFYLNLRV